MNREALIYYSCKYQGNYNRIVLAIKAQESYQVVNVEALTILDDKYPCEFKMLENPLLYYFIKVI